MKRLLITITILLITSVVTAHKSEEVRITHFSEADGYGQDIVSSAVQDHDGYVWIGTWNGLCRYDGYRFQNYRMRPGDNSPLRTNRIGSIRELPDHDLECTTNDSLTFVFHRRTGRFELTSGDYSKRPRPYKADDATLARLKSLPQFANVFTSILLVDRQGGIWVDTHSGLYRVWFGAKPLQPVKLSGAAEEEVHCLYVDKKDRTWVADKNGHVRVGDKYLTPKGELSTTPVAFGQNVYCILEDSQGDLWLGAKPDGLTRLKASETGEGYTVKRYVHDENDPNSLSCDNIYDMVEDGQQRLWIATYKGGLNMYDLRQKHDGVFLHKNNGLSGWPTDVESDKVRCLHITPQQVLIAGTLNGLYTCSLGRDLRDMKFWHHCRRPDDATSLSNNWVMDIEPLRDHTVAIATSGGGFCLTDDRRLLSEHAPFCTFTTDQGLPSDVCLSLFFKPSHGLYIVSQTSISCFSLSDSTVTNYTRGTLDERFKLLDTKPVFAGAHLLFGTTQGVLSVSPQDMQKSNYQPPLVFDCSSDIRLSPDERSLTIQFAALDFNKNVPITYAYRIEGMDNRWIYITDNHITLPDIPAGTFRLHLRSTNGDGVWADNEHILTIHRRAAFHETPWAWMLYGLLLALLVIGIYRVVRYICLLQNEIKDIRLTSNQRIEVMSERIRELLSIKEAVEKIEQVEVVENEEDRLFAERVKTFVNEHLGDSNLSMQDFAQAMAISRTLLFARMKSVFNTSPNNYLLNQRIERAKTMLRQPNVLVADVAYRCGFSDPKYFSKCFKKLTGQTPSEFQKS